jgi:hypothetical protein
MELPRCFILPADHHLLFFLSRTHIFLSCTLPINQASPFNREALEQLDWFPSKCSRSLVAFLDKICNSKVDSGQARVNTETNLLR